MLSRGEMQSAHNCQAPHTHKSIFFCGSNHFWPLYFINFRNYVPYVVQLCRRHASSWSVCQSTLRVFNWLSTDSGRMEMVCRNKVRVDVVYCGSTGCINQPYCCFDRVWSFPCRCCEGIRFLGLLLAQLPRFSHGPAVRDPCRCRPSSLKLLCLMLFTPYR